MKYLNKNGFAGAAIATAMALPAMAQETVNAVVIDGYPARALWVQEFTDFFIPEVDRILAETGEYQMSWQENYGGSIVKPRGVLEGIQLGLGDIGIVTTIFHSSKLPSQGLSGSTPFVASDARAVAQAVDEIAREFPAMNNEFAAQNQVYLATGVVLDSYQLFCAEPIESVADLQGRKVAGAGLNLRYLEGIPDVAGVRGGLTDFYNMLQTGLVDCVMIWPESAVTFNIVEVGPYMIQTDFGSVNTKTITANADYWAGLPDAVKEAISEASIAYRDHVAGIAMDRAEASLAAYVEAGGTIIEISDEDRAAWANGMPNIAAELVATLNENGEDGDGMLAAYLGKLEAAGYTPIRDWAAE